MKRIMLMMAVLVVSLVQTGCCGWFGSEECYPILSFYKYRPGVLLEDCTDFVIVHEDKIWESSMYKVRQVKLSNGYYLAPLSRGNKLKEDVYIPMANLPMPLDSLLAPGKKWEGVDTIRQPFEEFYSIIHCDCNKTKHCVYCETCNSTFMTDTAMLVQMIESGEIFKKEKIWTYVHKSKPADINTTTADTL